MLQVVEEKEKEKILNWAMGKEQEYFTKAKMNYFSKLIKNARCTFHSKIEGAKVLLTVFSAKPRVYLGILFTHVTVNLD